MKYWWLFKVQIPLLDLKWRAVDGLQFESFDSRVEKPTDHTTRWEFFLLNRRQQDTCRIHELSFLILLCSEECYQYCSLPTLDHLLSVRVISWIVLEKHYVSHPCAIHGQWLYRISTCLFLSVLSPLSSPYFM